MDVPAPVPEIASLLRHAGFVRALARSLVRDGHDAEDVEQDAWLAALRRPPADEASAHSWLARVVRNLVGQEVRSRTRRRVREEETARAEAIESHERGIEELETHERVVRAVLGLREPYRAAIVACYVHGLSAREAAGRLGVPHETLKTRVRRGLAELREELDRRHGGREAWMVLVAPLAGGGRELALTGGLGGGLTGGLVALKIGIASVVVALVSLVWWERWSGDHDVGTSEAARGMDSAQVREAPAAAGSPLESSPDDPATRRVAADPRASEPVPSSVEASRKPESGMFGTIVVVDELGAEHAEESGLLRLRGVKPFASGPFDLEVDHGHFSFPAAPAHGVEPLELVLGDRAAYLVDVSVLEPRGPLELRARWVPPVTLHVLDAEDGSPLQGVVVLRNRIAGRGQVHPGSWPSADEWARDATSPVELPLVDGQRTYWVGARDRAWKPVEIDHRSGGERRVELVRGARLTVECAPRIEGVDLRLRLYARDEPEEFAGRLDVPVNGTEPIELEGLVAGDHEVRAEIGRWSDPPRVLARAGVELVPGRHEHVRLVLEPGDLAREPVRLEGELVLPAECFGAQVRLRWQPLGRPRLRTGDQGMLALERMVARGDGSHSWFGALVTPGDYLITIDPFQWTARVAAGETGPVRIVVPALRRIEVRVRDAESGDPLGRARVDWQRARPREARVTTLETAGFDESAGAFLLLAPEGSLMFHCDEPDHESVSRSLEVGLAPQVLDVELRRLPSFTLTLRDGEVFVPLTWGIHVEVTPEGHEGEADRNEAAGPGAKFVVTRPGPYRIHVPALDGFAEVPDQVVYVDHGPPQAVELELRRR